MTTYKDREEDIAKQIEEDWGYLIAPIDSGKGAEGKNMSTNDREEAMEELAVGIVALCVNDCPTTEQMGEIKEMIRDYDACIRAEALREAADRAVKWVNGCLCDEHMPIMCKRMDELRATILADEPPHESFDFEAHLQHQHEWSEATFGPGDRTFGIIDHITKELLEIAAVPNDLEEWIDVVILALDGAWRIGHTPKEIISALVAKQSKNESRKWPDWRTAERGKAIEHVRDEPNKEE